MNEPEQLAKHILQGDKTALSKGITLVESTLPEDRQKAQVLLENLQTDTGSSTIIKIGITGVPGVGKSTFIESFGNFLIESEKTIAVLTVDPSSPLSGGSILGDKTRMETLSRQKSAFIRPSPNRQHPGGVALSTKETIFLCEAAGYDVVLVETVGVGQSEYQVASMVDVVLLLMLPNAGDELQGIKRGIFELAHIILINKADGGNTSAAQKACQSYRSALSLNGSSTAVLTCSSLEQTGMSEVWEAVEKLKGDEV